MSVIPTISGFGANVPGGTSVAGLDAGLQRLRASGCTHAELFAPHLNITVAGRDKTQRIDSIAAVCAGHDLRYSVHAPAAINFMAEAHTERHRAVLRSAIRFCARIGAGVLVIHPGRCHPGLERAEGKRLLQVERDELRAAADEAGRHGIRIGMENLNPSRQMMAGTLTSYALDPRRLAEQIDAMDHPFVMGVLDFGHGWLASTHLGFAFRPAVAAFSRFVGHLHVTDNCGAPITYPEAADDEHIAYGMGDLHLPIGWGSVPYDEVLPALQLRPGTAAILELAARHDEELEANLPVVQAVMTRLNAAKE